MENKALLKNKKIRWTSIAITVVVAAALFAAWILGKNHIDARDYISVQYVGANGYATAECQIDREKLYADLAGSENDLDKLNQYKEIAQTAKAYAVDATMLTNGDRILITLEYPKEIAESTGIKIGNEQYYIKVKGVHEGEKIDLFSQIEVVFAGISPNAYVIVNNNWADEYLSAISFSVDKPNGVVKDDIITVKCDASIEALGQHGFIPESTEQKYQADKLSTLITDVKAIDKTTLENLKKMCEAAVVDLTADVSFRMMYKATGNSEYLYQPNNENAENVSVTGTKFLTRKNSSEGLNDNFLYIFCKADVINDDEINKVYFGFEFTQLYASDDGKFHIVTDHYKEDYICSTSYEDLYHICVESKSDMYHMTDC